jgi:hypothetical protein
MGERQCGTIHYSQFIGMSKRDDERGRCRTLGGWRGGCSSGRDQKLHWWKDWLWMVDGDRERDSHMGPGQGQPHAPCPRGVLLTGLLLNCYWKSIYKGGDEAHHRSNPRERIESTLIGESYHGQYSTVLLRAEPGREDPKMTRYAKWLGQ